MHYDNALPVQVQDQEFLTLLSEFSRLQGVLISPVNDTSSFVFRSFLALGASRPSPNATWIEIGHACSPFDVSRDQPVCEQTLYNQPASDEKSFPPDYYAVHRLHVIELEQKIHFDLTRSNLHLLEPTLHHSRHQFAYLFSNSRGTKSPSKTFSSWPSRVLSKSGEKKRPSAIQSRHAHLYPLAILFCL